MKIASLQCNENCMSGNVRPKLLYNAAKKFVLTPLALEEGIEFSTNWYQDYNTDELEYFSHDNEFYSNNAIYETLLTSDQVDFMNASNTGT
ncbi:1,4-alpha-glucan branching enzyme GlgB [Frankliniella fusca]|uniref:1,4-alpha-glucan branching enzyme GlgB n=1 Tax=Frankliniella fusca TaxID=407009 RepID=A0AAE1LHQ5_9NEOP|nr:1,4-alpha-glucan branching enzyme GlgB [Frankliniella fusca]